MKMHFVKMVFVNLMAIGFVAMAAPAAQANDDETGLVIVNELLAGLLNQAAIEQDRHNGYVSNRSDSPHWVDQRNRRRGAEFLYRDHRGRPIYQDRHGRTFRRVKRDGDWKRIYLNDYARPASAGYRFVYRDAYGRSIYEDCNYAGYGARCDRFYFNRYGNRVIVN